MRLGLLLIAALGASFGIDQLVTVDKDIGPPAGPVTVTATPLTLMSSQPAVDHLGSLHFIAAWHLKSPDPSFGGISSLLVEPDGQLLGLSDTGLLTGLGRPPASGGKQVIRSLPVFERERHWPRFKMDTESMVTNPKTGRSWVGFELQQRICRYSAGFTQVEACRVWPEMMRWPSTGGPEAMVRLTDGRFLVFSEMGNGPDTGNDLLLFSGDPASPRTKAPIRMNYVPPQGYRPTDAVSIGKNRLLVLNRRATLYDGFTAMLALVDIGDMKPRAVLRAQTLALLAPPVLADNFEALAVEQRGGRTILWIASDDNHKFFQRTLLLEFALPPELSLP
ncbi:esterase-like activity of phytase family protein [Sphingobium subterraneum]|uniref:Phytase-like domain-containing protein n=1 Tax=Sphingobium subterraneum TaxID=627688 RepID=A0A841J985_9SPHN|nr:esterase-like activity of phytase family protein [Sphingobium subterraneum]MBB6125108.1 hypothetical protein [Sphingobium subterraneum]